MRAFALAGRVVLVTAGLAPTARVATPAAANTAAVAATAVPQIAAATEAPTFAATAPPQPTSTPGSNGALVEAALGNLSKTLHPYPDSASYTQSWIDAAALIWGGADGGGALLAFDWDALDYRPAMAREMPQVSSDGKTYTFALRDDLKWS